MTNALTLPVLTATDSLEHYSRLIKAYPILTADEEYTLAVKFKEENDLESARQLIVSHLRLVASIARGYMGYGLPQADLIQEGNIGLMKAVKRYDPERGVRLVSFAMHWIKAEIHEYIVRNWRLVKIATTKAQRKLFFNLRSMKTGLHSLQPAEVAHIARELNVKPEEVLEMESRLDGHEISLEANIDDDSDDHYSPIAYLQDEGLEPLEAIEAKQSEIADATGLAHALKSLDDRSRRVVEARWLQQDNTSKTLHELADEFGVSAERIRQIEQKAMQKMKILMIEYRQD